MVATAPGAAVGEEAAYMREYNKTSVPDSRRSVVVGASSVAPANVIDPFAEGAFSGGFSEEMRAMAFGLVLQLGEDDSDLRAANEDGEIVGSAATFRLAHQEDIATICDFRCAQSVEYWGLAPSGDACRLFHAETEAFLRRTLNTSVFFALVEQGGEVVSMSGLEAADRIPTISAHGGAQRSATVVACYTPPQHRGRGFMRRMLSAWTSMAPMLGIDTIYMETHNDSMRHLAQSAGYEHVSDKYRLTLPVGEPLGADAGSQVRLVAAC